MKSTTFLVLAILFAQVSLAGNSLDASAGLSGQPLYFSENKDTIDVLDIRKSNLNYVSTKALRHFVKVYKEAEDMKWYLIDDGFVVYFTMEDTAMKLIYDVNGCLLNTYSYYDEKNAPAEIKELVRRDYYPYAISKVVKLEENWKVAYYVKMENENSLLSIRIYEGKIEELENFRKSTQK